MPLSASPPTYAFIPKYHWLPFFVDNIAGSRAFASFLVDHGASMIVASTNVPERSVIPWSVKWLFT
jgi:hypothetical protein